MYDSRRSLIWLLPFLLLLLLPACSVMPVQPALEGFSSGALQQVRQQSAELERLQKLDAATPPQQQHIKQLRSNLQQFERAVIRRANRLEQQNDWHGAAQTLTGATRVLPDSTALSAAQRQLAERRHASEERVRMELAIHRGEQLLNDVEAYQRLQQLQGPGLMSWLELKNFHRKRRASADVLQEHAQRAMEREDYPLAQRALEVAQGLYGDDLQQNNELREALDRDLALISRQLRKTAVQPKKKAQTESAKAIRARKDKADITALHKALANGDLINARPYLDRLRQRSPQHPQLPSLQARFQTQLNTHIKSALKRGNDLYSQGEIERALGVWREAKTLAPSNVELLANIARAEKVLENLKALSMPARTSH